MTIDERIEKLARGLEDMQDAQRRSLADMQKTQVMLAQVTEGLMRLERIAISHEVRLDDVETTLARLEGRERKPQ